MPLYEYGCPDCLHAWEVLLDRHDSTAPDCPLCGATAERRVSTFAVVAAPSSRPASPASGGCGSSDCACRREVHQD